MIVLFIALAFFLIVGLVAYSHGYDGSEAISSQRAEYTVWGSE